MIDYYLFQRQMNDAVNIQNLECYCQMGPVKYLVQPFDITDRGKGLWNLNDQPNIIRLVSYKTTGKNVIGTVITHEQEVEIIKKKRERNGGNFKVTNKQSLGIFLKLLINILNNTGCDD